MNNDRRHHLPLAFLKYKSSGTNPWEKAFTIFCFRVKLPKESSTTGRKSTLIELFEQQGEAAWFCPLRALQMYLSVVHNGSINKHLPLMRLESGKGYCRRQLNSDLKELLAPTVNYQEGPGILAHSFRAGVASTLARLGFSETVIAAQGRWSSACYQRYLKLGRAAKLSTQRAVASALAGVAAAPSSIILVP